VLAVGDAAWTVEFGARIDPLLHARVMALAQRVRAARAAGEPVLAPLLDLVPTFRSLTLHVDPMSADAQALSAWLQAQAEAVAADPAPAAAAPGRRWCLPACFDEDVAPDLAALAQAKGLSPRALVGRLLAVRFRVQVIGFMPGFPYMAGWPEDLAQPRLASPRAKVPARSLAVAGTMGCIYPWESPGGWHLLGRTPLPMFDLREADAPAWLAAGDTVRFTEVDRATHDALRARFDAGQGRRADFLDPEAA
jgi:KipI family sensor histidine kinase inhibitor